MGDGTRRRLRHFEGRTTVPVQGWGAVFVGLLFAGAGTIPLLIGVGMTAWSTQPTRPPGWVVAVAGAVFIIFGLAAFVSGLRGLYRRRRARRAYLAGATAPWDWDHPWERGGTRDDVWRRALRRFAWIGFLALFLSPFHYLLLTIIEDTTFRVLGGLFLLVFDAAVLFTFAGAVKAVIIYLTHQTPQGTMIAGGMGVPYDPRPPASRWRSHDNGQNHRIPSCRLFKRVRH